jgi:hypothetical protein
MLCALHGLVLARLLGFPVADDDGLESRPGGPRPARICAWSALEEKGRLDPFAALSFVRQQLLEWGLPAAPGSALSAWPEDVSEAAGPSARDVFEGDCGLGSRDLFLAFCWLAAASDLLGRHEACAEADRAEDAGLGRSAEDAARLLPPYPADTIDLASVIRAGDDGAADALARLASALRLDRGASKASDSVDACASQCERLTALAHRARQRLRTVHALRRARTALLRRLCREQEAAARGSAEPCAPLTAFELSLLRPSVDAAAAGGQPAAAIEGARLRLLRACAAAVKRRRGRGERRRLASIFWEWAESAAAAAREQRSTAAGRSAAETKARGAPPAAACAPPFHERSRAAPQDGKLGESGPEDARTDEAPDPSSVGREVPSRAEARALEARAREARRSAEAAVRRAAARMRAARDAWRRAAGPGARAGPTPGAGSAAQLERQGLGTMGALWAAQPLALDPVPKGLEAAGRALHARRNGASIAGASLDARAPVAPDAKEEGETRRCAARRQELAAMLEPVLKARGLAVRRL